MPSISLLDYLILGVASIVSAGLLTPFMRNFAIKFAFFDYPSSLHKSHSNPIPYLGGVAIIFSVATVVFSAVLYRGTANEQETATAIILPAAILGLVGLIDDRYNLSPLPRFFSQTVVAVTTVMLVIRGNVLGNPTGSEILDISLSILWIVGITNSINFFDNVDGGASGTVAIVSFSIFVIGVFNQQLVLAAISIVIMGSSLGFLVWNKSPARIYMGDAGALFLGFILSILTIRLDPKVSEIKLSLLVPLMLLGIPILDTSVAVLSRIRRRVSPFQGGRDHLSHRLMRIGFKKRTTVCVLWSLSAIFCALGILLAIGSKIGQTLSMGGVLFWILLLIAFMKTPDIEEVQPTA